MEQGPAYAKEGKEEGAVGKEAEEEEDGSSQGGGPLPRESAAAAATASLPWAEAADILFEGYPSECPSTPSRLWVLQRALPGRWLLVRGYLLLAGACCGLLHTRMDCLHPDHPVGSGSQEALTGSCPLEGEVAGILQKGEARESLAGVCGAASRDTADDGAAALAGRLRATARAAVGVLLAATCRSPQQVGFMPVPNSFELFWLHFSVDASATAWLLSCQAAPDGMASPPDIVSDALRAAVPLTKVPGRGGAHSSTSPSEAPSGIPLQSSPQAMLMQDSCANELGVSMSDGRSFHGFVPVFDRQ